MFNIVDISFENINFSIMTITYQLIRKLSLHTDLIKNILLERARKIEYVW